MEHEQNALPECSTAGAGAATSTADASTQLERWDVFISHAGEQTRSFACWLEQDLGRAGVKAFLDEHSLRLGDAADSIMEGAVRSAQIFICVLTPDYLRKRWTMQELRWALDQQQQPQQGRQLIIMPLFYGIDVDELKGHEALLQQHHPDHWQQYAADLAAVGRTMGLRKDVVDGFDNLYVKETVHQVLNQLERGPTLVADHPVGMEQRLTPMLAALQSAQTGSVVLGLWGMGGVGKTTLAMAAYNQLFRSFQRRAFVEVGEDADVVKVQHQLLSKLGDSQPEPVTAAEGAERVRRSLGHGGKVLLVLDNIWTKAQLEDVLHTASLPAGSHVIVTTRFAGLLSDDRQVHHRQHVQGLPEAEARQLFCWHAFSRAEPPALFSNVVSDALRICACLPLALKVVGDYLHSFRTVDEWQSELAFYESTGGTAHTDESVIKLLRRSFDILPNEQKHMFLDTATILHARPAGHLLAVWGSLPGSMPSAASMLGVLQSWSLVALDKKGNLSVHDSLRKMAQLVAAETAAAAWSLLTDVSQDTRQDPSAATRLQLSSPGRLRSLKGLLQAHPHAALVVIDSCPACGFHVFYPEVVSQQLLYLRTQLVDRRPRWSVNMGALRVLDLHGSAIMELPNGISTLRSLKVLDLSSCRSMLQLPPSISALSRLEILDMSGCCSLIKLPQGVCALSSLQTLDLNGCDSLPELPPGISTLSSLQTLVLRRCNSLAQLPPSISALSSLQHLDLSWCGNLAELPPGIGALSSLQVLTLSNCRSLAELPPGISALSSLQTLDLSGCISLAELQPGISALGSLRTLDLSSCRTLAELPSGISALSSLQTLDLKWCISLAELPLGISALCCLQTLDLYGCSSLTGLPSGIGALSCLRSLDLRWCRSLAELPPGIDTLEGIER